MAIRKRGKVWQVELRLTGHDPIYRTFGTKIEAKSFELEQKILVERGLRLIKKTFAQAAWRYLEEISPTHKSHKQEKRYIEKYQRHWLGSIMVSQMKDSDIERYIEELRGKKLKDSSIIRELKIIHWVMNESIRWRYCRDNPTRSARKPKNSPSRVRRISEQEISQICKALGYKAHERIDSQKKAVGLAFLLAIETGMRQGEIYDLLWSEVYWDRHYVYLRTSKNGDSRYVPLSEVAEALLRQMQRAGHLSDRVFPYHQGSSASVFSQAVRQAGIVDLHFHDSRHEACSRLARLPGMDSLKLAKIIGHRDPKSLMIYFNPHAEELVEVIRGIVRSDNV